MGRFEPAAQRDAPRGSRFIFGLTWPTSLTRLDRRMIAQLDPLYLRKRPVQAAKRIAACLLFEGRALLQSWRWVNPLVRVVHALSKAVPSPVAVRSPIYIMGTGRSGTTILGTVLSYHRQTGYLNEPKLMWHAANPNEDVIGSFTDAPASVWLTADDATPAVSRKFRRLYGWFLAATLSKRIVDKNAELPFRIEYLRAMFPDARFLLLVRNGYDTCTSIERWSQTHGQSAAADHQTPATDWWGKDSRKWHLLLDQVAAGEPELAGKIDQLRTLTADTDRAALEWALVMHQGMKLADAMPECVHVVRYEQLTAQPKQTLEAIRAFCDLSPDTGWLNYAQAVLQPNTPKPALDLHPAVGQIFHATMAQLGYDTAPATPAEAAAR